MSTTHDPQAGHREKSSVALSSVGAAVVLTGMKLAAGMWTGSLGILSEALHSALDLVAALITLWAVRAAARPADAAHPYGHGKVENLSALFETVLLLITCGWITYEAIERLFVRTVEVEASVIAFVVVLISIVIDISRSRALSATARKYNSQALEADALHFSTDVWSSSVVFVGLGCVALSGPLGAPWLIHADALAALGVAGIVIWVSLRLGKKSVDDLLDAVPPELLASVTRAASVPGVTEVGRVRVRRSGPETFVDLTVTAGPDRSFEGAHELTRLIEEAVQEVAPAADVVVHIEPTTLGEGESPTTTVQLLAARHGLRAHSIAVDGPTVTLHVELDPELALADAHPVVTALERDVCAALPAIARVVTHIEPAGNPHPTTPAPPPTVERVRRAVEGVCSRTSGCGAPHEVEVRTVAGGIDLSFHCLVEGAVPVREAHGIAERIETALRIAVPALRRVTIHVEPAEPP